MKHDLIECPLSGLPCVDLTTIRRLEKELRDKMWEDAQRLGLVPEGVLKEHVTPILLWQRLKMKRGQV